MSDTTTPVAQTTAQPNGGAAATPAEPNGDAEVDYKAKYEETLAHSRQWEQRAKENKAAAEKLAQVEEAQKTTEQKQADQLAALQAENAAFKAEKQQAAWAKEVAEATGVPAGVLRGSTLEELQAHAELLKPAFAKEPEPLKPVPTIGNQPRNPGNVSLPEQIAAAEAAGNHQLVAALKAMQLGAAS
ncbi:helicase [Leucobacter muris]|uniref:Helicase n=1 Tax=Leucobacter muris TaxID=1935379 RepID=A0ABX5QDK6_9MICO|nr:helicase [Leucobacter muris]QAB17126.1 helicase [Leucobacter muris]